MPELEHATIDEIWNELRSRYEGLVLTYQARAPRGDHRWMLYTWWHSELGVVHALGLSEYAVSRVRRELDVRMGDPEDEDDEGDQP